MHFAVYQEDVTDLAGRPQTYEYVWRTDGARIIALDGSNVLLTREYRQELDGHDWRLPGGKVDPSEAPEDAARREFQEETGCTAREWQFLWSTTPDATVRFQRHFFLARDVEAGTPDRDPAEHIENHWVSLGKACRLAIDGEVREEISALALLRVRHGALPS